MTKDQPVSARPLGAVLVLALAVRGAAIGLQFHELGRDPDDYRALAENLLNHGVLGHGATASAYRPPLYPLCLALVFRCGGMSPLTAGALHLALGAASVALVLCLAQRWGLQRNVRLAAALVLFDPILLRQSSQIMTETLATLLACAGLIALTLAGERPSLVRSCAAGACLGLAALCRPTFLMWLPGAGVSLAALLPTWSVRAKHVGLLVGSTALVVAPWAARNARALGRPVVTTTHGGYTLLLGNNPSFYAYLSGRASSDLWKADELDREVIASSTGDQLADDRRLHDEAWRNIREQPGTFVHACLYRLGRLWGVVPYQTNERESGPRRMLRYATALWYVAEFALAAAGVAGLGRRLFRQPWVWGLWLAACFTAVHTIYWSDLRMRSPLVPITALLAAHGWACLTGWLEARKPLSDLDLK